ncbi:PEP-CTERM sorting domain-containing protein [Aureliella helgolandensis]|uniref:PEP-CTERM sorting domain-containing protein n=1 Tax=Aureliella helgolandensis TaxID=2527968 RepID=UPI0018D1CF1A|nr:PEP-CTERM sorting domain-containing protein [Aureliella helgolandensis]
MWFNQAQGIDDFSASFHYQVSNGNFGSGYGLTFAVHNDPRGLGVISNSNFNYGFQGIAESAGVTLELNGSTNTTEVGFYRNGVIGSGAANVAPHFPGGAGFDVLVDYNGSILNVTVADGINTPFTRNYFVSPTLQSSIGDGNAFIGFGASSGSGITQVISDFRFESTAIPEPSSTVALIAITGFCSLIRRRRQTI